MLDSMLPRDDFAAQLRHMSTALRCPRVLPLEVVPTLPSQRDRQKSEGQNAEVEGLLLSGFVFCGECE